MTIDVSKASRETLEEYADKCEATDADKVTAEELDERIQKFRGVQAKLRAECTVPKLRSRAEVDAELAHAARDYHLYPGGGIATLGEMHKRLMTLCAEPTAEPEEERGKVINLTTNVEELATSLCIVLTPTDRRKLAALVDPDTHIDTEEEPVAQHKLDPVTQWALLVANHVADECDHDSDNYDGSDSTVFVLDQYIAAKKGEPTACAPKDVEPELQLNEYPEVDPDEHLSPAGRAAKALERDGLPEVEPCSCEEAEKLRGRIEELLDTNARLRASIEIERSTSRELRKKLNAVIEAAQ